MNRRHILAAATFAALARPAFAQPRQRLVRIGFLHPGSPLARDRMAAVREGFGNGSDPSLAVEFLPFVGNGDTGRMPALAAASTVPIVAVNLESDPVESMWVASLARPGGNVSGIFLDLPGLSAKCVERRHPAKLARPCRRGDRVRASDQRRLDSESRGRVEEAPVVARKLDRQAAYLQERHRSQMERIERPNRGRKRLERASQYRRGQLEQTHCTHDLARVLRQPWLGRPGMHAIEHLVLEKPARHERLIPKLVRRRAPFIEKAGQRDRRIEVDQRSPRLSSRSRMISSNVMVAFRRGGSGVPGGVVAGVSQPSRTPRARNSSSGSARPGCGGTSSATTRSRSVTSTVSPAAAARTYSLSLFFSTLRPTERTVRRGSHWKRPASSDAMRCTGADEVIE